MCAKLEFVISFWLYYGGELDSKGYCHPDLVKSLVTEVNPQVLKRMQSSESVDGMYYSG